MYHQFNLPSYSPDKRNIEEGKDPEKENEERGPCDFTFSDFGYGQLTCYSKKDNPKRQSYT